MLIKSFILGIFAVLITLKRLFMDNLGNRIQNLRKKVSLTHSQFAEKIDISHTQMARYEIKGVQPPADVLKKLADVFGVTVDYLINGDTEEKAKANLKDTRLLQLIKAVENLNENDKNIITEVISTFVFQRETQKRLAI